MLDSGYLSGPQRPRRPNVIAQRHVVVSGHYYASLAGLQILEAGGNAIDAGVATGLAIDVLESQFVGFGGVAPIMIHLAGSDAPHVINGVGVWPKAANLEHFHRNFGGRIPDGMLQTVVPAAPANWIDRAGTLRHHVVRRCCGVGDPFRARGVSDVSVLCRDPDSEAGRDTAVSEHRRDLSAERPRAGGWRDLRTGRSGSHTAIHGGSGGGARAGRSECGAARRARCVLLRRHRRRDRAAPAGERRLAGGGRPGGISQPRRAAMSHPLRRIRCVWLRRLVAGSDGAGGAEYFAGSRSEVDAA